MKPLSILVSAALLGSASLATLPAQAALPGNVAGQEMPSLAPMLEQVTPAVVSINVAGTHVSRQRIPDAFRFFFGPNAPQEQTREQPFEGLGSGVIIDAKNGYVVTNNHVVDEADKIEVSLTDGRTFKAKKIGADKDVDIALLQIEADGLTQIQQADSDELRVGDFAVAIGNPLGLGQTVTSGIVSALGRSDLQVENLENFIQTDAAINRGNSGGALVNLRGELIGINTAIIGPNGGNIGIGFAIPVNMMKNLVKQIVDHGEVRRGYLGIMGGELTHELAKAMGYKSGQGAFVSQVLEDSAADKAGIKAGDIVTHIDGKAVKSFGELRAKVATLGEGAKVKLGLVRDGDEKTVTVTLTGQSDAKEAAGEALHPRLDGAEFENDSKGIKVTKVAERSPAAYTGLEQGDIIVGVNRQRVKTVKDLEKILDSNGDGGVLALNIIRGRTSLYLVIR
ncbi:Do family serine endopeptidase [Gallaecimonas xiamenensis]|uniref:Serine protease n=1 Tax=Gallaecimonas xiamenensis 3-C-1 TaxID=745411 RepID=K2K1V0_9GAMM|nr:Do family serine endopeptidase [Gallaecimonas xiamenensis]EKE71475.1 serine protease [Gallaecimonas xiamenensis 3-C-1]